MKFCTLLSKACIDPPKIFVVLGKQVMRFFKIQLHEMLAQRVSNELSLLMRENFSGKQIREILADPVGRIS